MSAYLYILYSEKTDRYYVGSADDVEARLKHHNAGSTPSTKAGAPMWELKYTEEFPTRGLLSKPGCTGQTFAWLIFDKSRILIAKQEMFVSQQKFR
jgi:hypothetical protein